MIFGCLLMNQIIASPVERQKILRSTTGAIFVVLHFATYRAIFRAVLIRGHPESHVRHQGKWATSCRIDIKINVIIVEGSTARNFPINSVDNARGCFRGTSMADKR